MGLLPPLEQKNPNPSPSSMPLPTSTTAKATMNCAALPPSPVHDADDDCGRDLNDSNLDAAPHIEQLLVNHLRFAQAFRKNDAAMILHFLAKDVVLIAVDGSRYEGQSAVLAYLVGTRMSKLSSNLRVKGCPTRSDAWQSTFIYEHGIVFKDPLYMEILDWKPNSATVVRIAHVTVPNAKNAKIRKDVNKKSSERHSFRRRHSDDDVSSENSEESDGSDLRESEINTGNNSSSMGKMRLRRKQSSVAESCNRKSPILSGSHNSQSGASDRVVLPLEMGTVVNSTGSRKKSMAMIKLAEISCSDLSPIRKRKTVNPFVVFQRASTGSTWKSPVLRRNPHPKWDHVPLKIPVANLADVIEISLWDHTLFHSVKVAGAAVVASDLITDNTEFISTIKLKRVDANRASDNSQYVTMQLRFVRLSSHDIATFSLDEMEQNSGQYHSNEPSKAVVPKSTPETSLKGFVMESFGHNVSVSGILRYAFLIVAIVLMLVITTHQCKHHA